MDANVEAAGVDDRGEVCSIREAARASGLSEKTIRRRIKAGDLPAFQVATQHGLERRVTSLDTNVEDTHTQPTRVDAPDRGASTAVV